jgi:phage terminase small subunit
MASENNAETWTWVAMEPEPTEQERALLDLFCQEYLRDSNTTQAASRCGFQAGFAEQYGQRFFARSYVQRRLAPLREAHVDEKHERQYDTRAVKTILREIMLNPYQRPAARVAAAAKMASIYGMDAPVKSQVDINQRGGVMQVPGIASLDDWEAAAQASQTALAEASRV